MARFLWQSMAGTLAVVALVACAGNMAPAADDARNVDWPDSRWTVTAVVGEDGRLVEVPAGVVIDLAFDAKAAGISGSAGCNRYSATATVAAAQVAFSPAGASKRMCGTPEGVMALEALFLRALRRVAAAGFDGRRLELRSADGTPLLTLAPAPAL